MKPFGSKRTYAKCIVLKAKDGKARKFKLTLKNHKSDRAKDFEFAYTRTMDGVV